MLTVPYPIFVQRLAFFPTDSACAPVPAPFFASGGALPCKTVHVFTRQLLNSAGCEGLKRGAPSIENKLTCQRVNTPTNSLHNFPSPKLANLPNVEALKQPITKTVQRVNSQTREQSNRMSGELANQLSTFHMNKRRRQSANTFMSEVPNTLAT